MHPCLTGINKTCWEQACVILLLIFTSDTEQADVNNAVASQLEGQQFTSQLGPEGGWIDPRCVSEWCVYHAVVQWPVQGVFSEPAWVR